MLPSRNPVLVVHRSRNLVLLLTKKKDRKPLANGFTQDPPSGPNQNPSPLTVSVEVLTYQLIQIALLPSKAELG